MAKTPKPCIFCGKYGFKSKEHILARWLEEVFPRTATDTHTQTNFVEIENYRSVYSHSLRRNQGRTHVRKARVVCMRCNDGWMGDNQSIVKPILLPLIRGSAAILGKEAQRAVALWAVRAAMAAEYLEVDGPIRTPQYQRTALMDRKEPPPGWFVWISQYGGSYPDLYHELLASSGGILEPPPGARSSGPYHIQSVTIGLAKLIIYVVGTDLPGQNFILVPGLMYQIWPEQNADISWPLPLAMTDDELVHLTLETLRNFELNVPVTWRRYF